MSYHNLKQYYFQSYSAALILTRHSM